MKHEFVVNAPDVLAPETIYISIEYSTVVHSCVCGCGNEVVTPLSPTDWKITFDGESISIYPSIGNWSFDCKSHYWIKNNRIVWAEKWSDERIAAGRRQDLAAKTQYYNEIDLRLDLGEEGTTRIQQPIVSKDGPSSFWSRMRKLFLRR